VETIRGITSIQSPPSYVILIFNQEIDYDQIDMKPSGPETDDFGINSKN
jgi:hypothetical protein